MQQGGCLCGDLRYEVHGEPSHVTYCHCLYCQRVTGAAYNVKPTYPADAVNVVRGEPKTYEHISTRSGNPLTTHFCDRCGSTIFMTTKRNTAVCGILAGSLDDPNSFDHRANARHIFVDSAQAGTVVPAGVPIYRIHIDELDGSAAKETVYPEPHVITPQRDHD